MSAPHSDPNNFYAPSNQQHSQQAQAPYHHPQQQQDQSMTYQPQQQQQQYPPNPKMNDHSYASYAPQSISPTSYNTNPIQQDQSQYQPSQTQYYSNQHYPTTDNLSPPQSNLSYPSTISDYGHLDSQQPSHQNHQSSFYNMPQQQQQYQPQQQSQPPTQQPQLPGLQTAMPLMLAGMQQMSAPNNFNSALGAQLFQSLAPGAAGYTNHLFGPNQDTMHSFMRMPKVYFAVNHRYVLKKLFIILMPFTPRVWARQRGVDPGQFEGNDGDGVSYLSPREDVNAPDLYIPVMAFLTYVMMVGFVSGMRDAFRAEVLAKYFSKGLGVLSFEVLIIKLGLYLINARPTPWLDVIAYRGYKFVGVVLTMAGGLVFPKLYIALLVYAATAMAIFMMRSHRRIILPRDVDTRHTQDLARRNAFLLFLSLLQFPIYWVLVLDVRSVATVIK